MLRGETVHLSQGLNTADQQTLFMPVLACNFVSACMHLLGGKCLRALKLNRRQSCHHTHITHINVSHENVLPCNCGESMNAILKK